jgi:hypothetical protein
VVTLPEGAKHNYCRGCARDYARERRELPHVKEQAVGANRRRRYGITAERYQSMVEFQEGLCAICGQPETAQRRGITKTLAVDHNHTTGQIRGLLCHRCNTALGLLGDDPERLQAVIRYLA